MRKWIVPIMVLALLMCALSISAAQDLETQRTVSSTRIVAYYGEQLQITSTFGATTILDIVGSNSASLGNVTINSNVSGSWLIRVSSSNGGSMKGDTPGNTFRYPYTLNFGGSTGINLTNDYLITKTGIIRNETYPVSITFTRVGDMANLPNADTYRDVITVSLGAI